MNVIWSVTIYFSALSMFYTRGSDALSSDQLDFIASYFDHVEVRTLISFTCSENEAIETSRFFSTQTTIMLNVHVPNQRKDSHTEPGTKIQGMLLNWKCYHHDVTWMNGMFSANFVWLIYFENWSDVESLKLTKLYFESNVVISKINEDCLTLHKVHRLRPRESLTYFEFGKWLNGSLQLAKTEKATNLKGSTVVGALVINSFDKNKFVGGIPPNLDDRALYHGMELFSRFHLVIFQCLEKYLNFRLKIVRSDTYGYPLGNGSFDGVIGDIIQEKVDVSVTAIEARAVRAKVVDFLLPIWKMRMIFVLRQPRAFGSFSALLMPFSYGVWIGILILAVTYVFSYDFITNLMVDRKLGGKSHLGFVIVAGALAQQGLSMDVNKLPIRMLCFFLLGLSLMVMSYYNAAVMNALLLPAPVSIKTLDQLLAPSSPIRSGLLNITYLVDNRSSHQYVSANTIEAVKKTTNPIMELAKGIRRVKNSNFAFCAEDQLLYEEIHKTFTDAQKCDLSYIPLIRPFGLSCVVSKNSPFKEILTRGLIFMMENGISNREHKHWRSQSPQCLGSISFIHVTLKSVGLAFAVLALGVLASSLIFIAELYVMNKNSTRRY